MKTSTITRCSSTIEKVLNQHRTPVRVTGGAVTPEAICYRVILKGRATQEKIEGCKPALIAALDVKRLNIGTIRPDQPTTAPVFFISIPRNDHAAKIITG